jgi:hypothetical protein
MQDYVPHRSAQRVRWYHNVYERQTDMPEYAREFKRRVGNLSRDYRLADRNFIKSRGGIPELPPDVWRKIMPIHYPTLVAMRNVSRGLHEIVNAMIASFQPGFETLAAFMTGRNIRRAMQTTRSLWPRRGYLTTDHVRQVQGVVDNPTLTTGRELLEAFPQSLRRTSRDQRQHNRTYL